MSTSLAASTSPRSLEIGHPRYNIPSAISVRPTALKKYSLGRLELFIILVPALKSQPIKAAGCSAELMNVMNLKCHYTGSQRNKDEGANWHRRDSRVRKQVGGP